MRLFVKLWGLTLVTTVLLLPGTLPARAQLRFNFNAASAIDPRALQGFREAGALWSATLNDNMTVNIDVGFSSLGGGILAQAGSATVGLSYASVRTALTTDARSLSDLTAVANLQAGPALQFVTNNTDGTSRLDNDGGSNNAFLDVNRANAKALGLLAGGDTARDATITFSSDFTYDFDRSDGVITAGTFDFVGLAVHEIGHALGFVSGVDDVDFYSGPNAPGGQRDLNGLRVFSVLDLYRFSSQADTNVDGFGRVQDLRQGAAAYFSLDRGATNLGLFSTGPYDGDGRQASHWKDNLGLGALDPTAAPGELLRITALDTQAFDVIGYNVAVPEPSPAALAGAVLAFAVPLARRRNHRRRFR